MFPAVKIFYGSKKNSVGKKSLYFSILLNWICRMTDIEKQTAPEKMEGGAAEAAFAPPPYPTDPDFMQQPPPYVAPPYPYGPTVYPAYPPIPPNANVPPPAQEINSQGSPAEGAGTNCTMNTSYITHLT